MAKVGTVQSFSWRRVLLALLAVGYVVLGGMTHASAQTDGDPKTDPPCPTGQVWDGEACVDAGCAKDETYVPDKGCVKVELVTCPDGSQAKTERECPPTTTTTSPCPDGAEQCGQFRSCPVDAPLPPGSTCEATPSTTTTAPPVPPAPTPPSDGNVFGRPAAEGSSGSRAAVEGIQIGRGGSPQLATTGLPDVLMLSATGLIAVGAAMMGWVRRRDRSMLLG